MARSTRRFGPGPKYEWRNGYRTKREAQDMAKHLRGQGYAARVVRGQGEWELWRRLSWRKK